MVLGSLNGATGSLLRDTIVVEIDFDISSKMSNNEYLAHKS